MTKGQTCFLQEYCTNCPLRAECGIRPLFYSEEAYNKYKNEVLSISTKVAAGLGYSKETIPMGLNIGIQMMDKRRKKELELHPTYSIK